MVNTYKLVQNETKYYEFIRNLRNNPKLLAGFIDKTYITPEMQEKYMQKHKEAYYICIEDEIPVGFIGIVDKDLRLAVSPEHQRKGIASFMLKEIMKIIPDFEVRVLPNNSASLNMFKQNGFIENGFETKSGVKVIKMIKGA